ncbi:MAG: hypothetical protein HS117_19280 [Verrucomicrobiaceae bacterium]|nr:hypothetical protein [Verrucomicrobiaceae bacterium]
MNITEAWEQVLRAAEMYRDSESGWAAMPRLPKAITKVKPRVERMRQRLDSARARRAGKPKCPRWAEP